MSWRPRSRRLAVLGVLALLVLISIEGAAQVRKHLEPEQAPARSRRTSATVPMRGTFWISGRLRTGPVSPAGRRWWSSSTAGVSSAATSRACRRGWWTAAWRRGSRWRRPTTDSRPRHRSRPRCSTAPGLSSSSGCKADGAGNRSRADRGLRQLGRRGDRALGRIPRRPGRPQERRSRFCASRRAWPAWAWSARRRRTTLGSSSNSSAAGPTSTSRLKPLFGVTSDAEADSPRVHRLYEESSPLNYVSADDPPVILFYSEPNAPLSPACPSRRGHPPPPLRRGPQGHARSPRRRVHPPPQRRLSRPGTSRAGHVPRPGRILRQAPHVSHAVRCTSSGSE